MWLDSKTSGPTQWSTQANSFTPPMGILTAAFFAMVTLHLFRLRSAWNVTLAWCEFATFALIPVVALFILKLRLWTLNPKTISKSTTYRFQAGGLLVAGLMIAWHLISRSFGAGNAYEVVVLLVCQSVAWYLAVFSKVPGFEKTSAVLCGAIVFFVVCMADRMIVFVAAALFAITVLWWLLGRYWDRLEHKSIDGRSKSLQINGSAIGGTTIVIAIAALLATLVPTSNRGLMFSGFMPFSGGENGMQDDFARSGIGDGDMLKAGRNATTTGAVDSDFFIEGHKPSMYDVTSEQYDGPITKKRSTRSIALEQVANHIDGIKQSEQSGRSFRTMRGSNKTSDLEFEDRTTKALFFVEGSAPARFVNNTFHHFDGWDWSNQTYGVTKTKMPKIRLDKESGTSVFRLTRRKGDYLTGRRQHRVKVMRLETSTLPASSLVTGWRIDHVNQLDLFRWNEAGLIRMDGEFIPTHAVIDIESFVPNYHLMRSDQGLKPTQKSDTSNVSGESAESQFLQIPDNSTSESIDRLATQWTTGIKPGWGQVEAIVDRMRNDYELNPNWNKDAQVDDTVGHFFEQHGGPSYMFATTCALALRSAGYPTRLTSGFLVQKADYDWKARQSIVSSKNLHMWPEVCLDGKFWVPVEPTPGYPIPFSNQTAWQWATAKAFMVRNWIWKHPVTSVLSIAALTTSVLMKAELLSLLMLSWWYLIKFFWPNGLLKATRQLIDLRFRVAGDPRPESTTIGVWYRRVEPDLSVSFFDLWNANNFSTTSRPLPKSDLVSTCSEPLGALTLKNIREFISTTKKAYRE